MCPVSCALVFFVDLRSSVRAEASPFCTLFCLRTKCGAWPIAEAEYVSTEGRDKKHAFVTTDFQIYGFSVFQAIDIHSAILLTTNT